MAGDEAWLWNALVGFVLYFFMRCVLAPLCI